MQYTVQYPLLTTYGNHQYIDHEKFGPTNMCINYNLFLRSNNVLRRVVIYAHTKKQPRNYETACDKLYLSHMYFK